MFPIVEFRDVDRSWAWNSTSPSLLKQSIQCSFLPTEDNLLVLRNMLRLKLGRPDSVVASCSGTAASVDNAKWRGISTFVPSGFVLPGQLSFFGKLSWLCRGGM